MPPHIRKSRNNETMKDICVVHLVRAKNGVDPFTQFLESYRQNPGGVDHDLLIVFKGFDPSDSRDDYFRLLRPYRFISFDVPDIGFDITPYFSVARKYKDEYRYFCFLNSFSVVQDHEWLGKLYHHISQDGVGMVGATGSWQGMGMTIPGHNIASVVKTRILSSGSDRTIWENLGYVMRGIGRRIIFPLYFPSFPNYHLRTNAFVVSGAILDDVRLPEIRNKMDAYKFESGRNSLTRQILGMGKQVLVIGKDGNSYRMEDWDKSNTFWRSEQQNLLVADNQTRDYLNGNPERREFLEHMAWGYTP